MTTKAIHLQVESDLTAEAFVTDLTCSSLDVPHLYSDCGTNFIGVEDILQKNMQDFV